MKKFDSNSLEERLVAVRRRSSGFDYLRLSLAFLIFLSQTILIVGGETVAASVWRGALHPFLVALMPMVFAASGFLVASSFEGSRTVISFFGRRIIRIFPALAIATVFSAFVLGPAFSTFGLGTYVSDVTIYAYLLNTFGSVHTSLPGVFASNVYPDTVNGQLWILSRELKCYVLLVALCFFGLFKPTRHALLLAFLLFVVYCAYYAFSAPLLSPFTVQGWVLIVSFIAGAMLFVYRRQIAFRSAIFIPAAFIALLLLTHQRTEGFAVIPLAYATVYLGLCNPPRLRIFAAGDFSYGIYLYGFPMQQAAMSLVPWANHWYVNVIIALPATVLLAITSMNFVERPASRLRGLLARMDDKFIQSCDTFNAHLRDWVRRSLSND